LSNLSTKQINSFFSEVLRRREGEARDWKKIEAGRHEEGNRRAATKL
jgi:CRISPR/Cas system CSM-associated protein Csm2 small subunit